MTWTTELGKSENDALRQAGDIPGIIAKYSALSGGGTWTRATMAQAFEVAGVSAAGWTDAQMSTFRADHLSVPLREVKLDEAATRTWVQANISADDWTSVVAQFGPKETLAESLSLPKPTDQVIRLALLEHSDSKQSQDSARHDLIENIRARVEAGQLFNMTYADLQSVDALVPQ